MVGQKKERKLLLIYGSPTPPARTASLLDYLEKEADERYSNVSVTYIQPSQFESSSLLYWKESDLKKVEEVDAIVIASPVYRASIPAILKQLFDEVPVRALRSKPVGLIAVGNIAEHYLGVERHVTDILTWFGSLYVPATCYITAPSLNEGIPVKEKEQLDELLESTIYLSQKLDNQKLGPMPIAEVYGR